MITRNTIFFQILQKTLNPCFLYVIMPHSVNRPFLIQIERRFPNG